MCAASPGGPDATIVVTGEECPLNYVRVKLRLEQLAPGQVLEAFVDAGAAARNVPRSAREEGHEVLSEEPAEGGSVRVLIQKREADRVT
jgi:tRNA 2-thiouridine synthesizing protein A